MLVTTITHTHGMKNDFPLEFAQEWTEHVTESIKLWNDYHKYWLDIAKDKTIPVIFLRFEDLLANQEETLEELLSYLLVEDSIKGMYVEQRLKTLINKDPT